MSVIYRIHDVRTNKNQIEYVGNIIGPLVITLFIFLNQVKNTNSSFISGFIEIKCVKSGFVEREIRYHKWREDTQLSLCRRRHITQLRNPYIHTHTYIESIERKRSKEDESYIVFVLVKPRSFGFNSSSKDQ